VNKGSSIIADQFHFSTLFAQIIFVYQKREQERARARAREMERVREKGLLFCLVNNSMDYK